MMKTWSYWPLKPVQLPLSIYTTQKQTSRFGLNNCYNQTVIKRLKSALFSGTSKDTLISLSGSVMVAIAGMVFSIVVARTLAPARFGVFSSIYALAMILSSLGDIGISSALINFLPKQPQNRQLIVSLAFWVQIVIGSVLLLAAISLIPFKEIIIPKSRSIHFVLLGLLGLVFCIQVFSVAVFKAEKKFFFAALISALDSWLKLSFIGLFFWFTPPLSIVKILLAALSASTIAAIIGLSFEFKGIRRLFPKQQAKEIFNFTKWITIMQVFNVFIGRLDTMLLNALHSDVAAGIFAAASRVTLVFVLLVSSLGGVVSPRFSGFSEKRHTLQYLKKLTLMVLCIAAFMAVTSLFAPVIIELVFGSEYRAAVPIFQALTVAMIPFLFTIVTISPLIYTFNQPNFVAKVTVSQVIILTVVNILLIPRLGAIAPAIGLAVSNLFTLTLTSLKLRKMLL